MTFALLYKVYSNIKLQYVVLQCWKSYKIKPQMHTTARRPAAQTPSLSSQMTLLWGDESAYRDEFCKLSEWCSINNLEPDTSKTSKPHQLQGPGRGDMWREWPASNHLTWAVNITSRVKKAQQRLYFLKLTCPSITALLKAFSPLTGVVASCTVADNEAVQRIIQSAQKITGTQLQSYTYTDPDAHVEPQT